jgi:UDP-N-acetylmuramate: L-alanyl-gamma-D-glutamyl-meso-diaminopimelate ligase
MSRIPGKHFIIAGSNGKMTITAMIMHIFRVLGIKFDFITGCEIDGSERRVGLPDDVKIALCEGNDFLTSEPGKKSMFDLFIPDMVVLNSLSREHINVFPPSEVHSEQLRIFIEKIPDGGSLIYFSDDAEAKKLALSGGENIRKIAYKVHGYFENKTGFYAATHNRVVPVKFFGEENMQNLSAAREACFTAGVGEDDFYEAIKSYEGV